jgi:hypothetical protein
MYLMKALNFCWIGEQNTMSNPADLPGGTICGFWYDWLSSRLSTISFTLITVAKSFRTWK